MKKISFLFVLLSVFISSYGEDRLVVDNTQIVSGESAYIVVKMDFAENHDYVSYQFNVELPSGISLIEETSGQASFVLPSNQPTNVFKITDFPMSNGILKVASNPSTVIADHEGTLVYIPVEAEAGLTKEDVLNGKLTNVVFAHKNATTEKLADVNFTITIADQVVLDENSEIAPLATSGNVNVKVIRKLTANKWSTICLPFKMSKAQAEAAFGNDVIVKEYKSYTADIDKGTSVALTLTFATRTQNALLKVGTPYLIKTSKDIESFEVDNVNIIPTPSDVSGNETEEDWNGKFKGTFIKTKVPDKALFISDNKFYYSNGKTKIKAFRGWFELDAVLNEDIPAESRVYLSFDDETTDINTVHGSGIKAEGTYDLQGRKIENPKKGLYINNGKKVVVK